LRGESPPLYGDAVKRVWTAVSVTAAQEMVDGVESFLLDLGAPGLVTEEAGSSVRLTAHYLDRDAVAKARDFCASLAALFPEANAPVVTSAEIGEEAWSENWKEHFQPLAVGRSLFLRPPWVSEVPPGRIPIVVDPGMAFGTGQHASTRGCLRLLEDAMPACAGACVLDLGTGSGVLAIAAVKLGAGRVCAVDIDEEACEIARANALANGVGAEIRIGGRLEDVDGPFDVILANLFAEQLVGFAPRLAELLRAGGVLVGAGILESEAAGVIAAWEQNALCLERRDDEDGWTALRARKGP
jgi:ribosomal protein L11 methyltransferase